MACAYFISAPTLQRTTFNPGVVFPSISYGFPNATTPSVQMDFMGTVSTTGSFSVNNPIQVSFILMTNMTGLTKHYCCMGLIDSSKTDMDYIPIQAYSNTSSQYHADSQIEFPVAGPIYIVLTTALLPFGNIVRPQSTTILLNISDVGDTYTWQYQHLTTQLTLVLVAFSVIFLQPVFEAIAGVKENPSQPQAQNNPQTESSHS